MGHVGQIVNSNTVVAVGSNGRFIRTTNWGGNTFPPDTSAGSMILPYTVNNWQVVVTDVEADALGGFSHFAYQ